MNDVIEWYLAPITVRDVTELEAAIPGFADALASWQDTITFCLQYPLMRYAASIMLRSHQVLSAALLFVACIRSETPAASAGAWQFPVRLGDSRMAVHQVLTAPSRDNGILEEYPSSGVALLYDAEGRVAKITILGAAANIYYSGAEAIPSSQPVLFGLGGRTNEAGFRRILGKPSTSSFTRAAVRRELQCVWKKGGFIISAEFLAAPRDDGTSNAYPPGTLLWFEVCRGI